MLKVGLTGNIASGKSTVEKIIKDKGFKVFDTDMIAHKILESNPLIKECFGTTNRKEIAKIVFSDTNKLKTLESIIHPLVKKELENIFENCDENVYISVPQLFEAGFESMFDKIIYITADESIRLKRLIARNNYSEEEALIRIKAQNELDKKEKADFIIENNSKLTDLEKEVLKVLNLISIG